MSDIQEKKDTVLKKLTKAQQKKLSLQEQIVNSHQNSRHT